MQEIDTKYQVLVFSRTNGYRHDSIADGIQLVQELGKAHGFGVTSTEEPTVFSEDSLAAYAAVIFMNTNGDVLEAPQEAAFKAYIQAGGGYVGVHSAAATEYEWPWYGGLVGAYFDKHPEPQSADVLVLDQVHPSTAHLPQRWTRFDEWYNYRANPRADVHVLAVLDEETYEGGEMGHDHPIAWAHEYEGGRAWYTGLGHTKEMYSDPLFIQHLLGGIEWAAGQVDGDVKASLAEHYVKRVLMDRVTDPMEIAVAEDGRVFLAERAGAVKVWDPRTRKTSLAGWIPVYMVIEDGLLGLTLDPNFADNGWMYLFYAPQDAGPSRLSRFTVVGNSIDMKSERVLLEIDVQRKDCCHAGGSLAFDAQGNLYLSTGDNTDPYDREGSPIDERTGRHRADAQRTSGNTNDLRGKIIRITPQPDGTYTIPEGNLFKGDALHRPEIYTMGHRNPFRIAVDPQTGWLFWGDVGNGDAPNARGGWGWDEFNLAKGPGNFGWPYFSGNNQPYNDFDYTTGVISAPFNAESPINDSPNNTGAKQLPPAQPAWIWYTYGASDVHPELGAGGINPMAGPVYRKPENASSYALPDYFEGKPIIYEWMRNWVKEVSIDSEGEIIEISPFLPGLEFVRPTDMEMGPDGALYVAEWGDAFWGSNKNAQVVRVEYTGAEDPLDFSDRLTTLGAVPERPIVRLSSPREGQVFRFGEPFTYEASIANVSDEFSSGRYEVRVYSGFDTHEILLETYQGAQGEAVVTREYTHTPDIHFVDRYAVVEACFIRSDGIEGCSYPVKMQPETKEAEQVSLTNGAVRHTYGTHPASELYPTTALTVMRIKGGHELTYKPIDLEAITSLTLRFKKFSEGAVVVYQGNSNRKEIGRIQLDDSIAATIETLDQMIDADEAVQHDEALNIDDVDRSVYENWSEVTIPLTPEKGSTTLTLVFESDSTDRLLELDWLKFN